MLLMKRLINKSSLTEQIYDIIKEMILNGRLEAGRRIDIAKLVEEFGISQTPVRFALNRLHDAGLVENRQREGFYVIELDEKDIVDTYDIREMFEIHALKSALKNVKTEYWVEIKKQMIRIYDLDSEEEKRVQFDKTDMDFHLAIMEGADNKKARELFMNVYGSVKVSLAVGGDMGISLRGHIEILNAIIDKDLTTAKKRLRAHLQDSKLKVIKQFRFRTGNNPSDHKKNVMGMS